MSCVPIVWLCWSMPGCGKEENDTEGPLDDRQRAAVFQARIVFADDVFRQLNRQADDQEDNNEEKNQN